MGGKMFVCDLEVHERGHIVVANMVAEAFSTTLSADGSNEGEARRKLAELRREHARQAKSEIDRLASKTGQKPKYDEVTDHGVNQSQGPEESYTIYGPDGEELATHTFPGGDNVKLRCE